MSVARRKRERKVKFAPLSKTESRSQGEEPAFFLWSRLRFGGLVNCLRSLAGRSLIRSAGRECRRQSLLTLGFSTLPDHDLTKQRAKQLAVVLVVVVVILSIGYHEYRYSTHVCSKKRDLR